MQPGELAHAHRMLLIPDLLHNWLCGSSASEHTNATTTQCWDPIAGVWVTDLLDQLEITTAMLDMPKNDKKDFDGLSDGKDIEFAPITAKDYQPIVDMVKFNDEQRKKSS